MAQSENIANNVEGEFQKFKEERDELCRAIEAQNENRQQLLQELQQLNTQPNQSSNAFQVTPAKAQIQPPMQMQVQTLPEIINPQHGIVYRSSLKQWVAGLAAASILFHPSIDCIWSPKPHDQPTGMFTVIHTVLVILGAFFGAILADIWGRKPTLLLTLVFVIPRLIWIIYDGASWVWIVKMFTDFASGVICTIVPLYISEIAGINNCGNLLVLQLLSFTIGLSCTVASLFGSLHYDMDLTVFTIVNSLLLSISVLFHGIILAVFPETPQYLNLKKRYQEAAKSLSFYTGINQLKVQETTTGQSGNSYSTNETLGCCGRIRQLTMFANRRSLAIILSIIVIRWTGGQQRNHEMLVDWDKTFQKIDSTGAMIGIYSIKIIPAVLILFAIKILERKVSILLVIFASFIIAIICMTNLVQNPWAYLALFIIQNFGNYILIGITLAYSGQFFPINVRAVAIAILISFEVLLGDIFIATENVITREVLSVDAVRKWSALNAVVCFCAFIFICVFFPRNNKLPNTAIAVETSTGANYLT